jgi:hypothetical protein
MYNYQKEYIIVYIRLGRSLRGVVATRPSQSETATPLGLAMTLFLITDVNYFMLSVITIPLTPFRKSGLEGFESNSL